MMFRMRPVVLSTPFRFGKLTPLWVMALYAAIHACSRESRKGGLPNDAPSSFSMDEEFLLRQDWRLFSLLFSRLPPDGYPIVFEANGKVHTTNLPLIKEWRLISDNVLVLSRENGSPVYELQWIDRDRTFVHRISDGAAAGQDILIAASGFPFLDFLQLRKSLR